jgi:hypothetical protein
MLIELIWGVGAVAGAIAGCAHAVDVYRRCDRTSAGGGLRGNARAVYHAVWTLALWVLFGAYVLIAWLLGMALYVAAGRPPPPAADTPSGGRS